MVTLVSLSNLDAFNVIVELEVVERLFLPDNLFQPH